MYFTGDRQEALMLAPGRMIDVGGRRLHLIEKGEGPGPLVVIEQGAGANSIFWWGLQDEVARFARVVTYDRAGLGWSDPVKGGRSIEDRVSDLHALLHAAGIPGPYLLVGHSYGGPMISLFAREYPGEVAGLVFADTPDMEHMTGPEYAVVTRRVHVPAMRVMRLLAQLGLPRLFPRLRMAPPGLSPSERAAWDAVGGVSAYDVAIDDIRSIWRIPQAARRPLEPGALGAKPVAVISHDKPFPGPFARLEEGFPESQERLAALSSNSRRFTARGGHLVQFEDPQTVVEAIRWAWTEARAQLPLAPAA
jgi:pimeloyl-ACP methyl ester carboxylesterase